MITEFPSWLSPTASRLLRPAVAPVRSIGGHLGGCRRRSNAFCAPLRSPSIPSVESAMCPRSASATVPPLAWRLPPGWAGRGERYGDRHGTMSEAKSEAADPVEAVRMSGEDAEAWRRRVKEALRTDEVREHAEAVRDRLWAIEAPDVPGPPLIGAPSPEQARGRFPHGSLLAVLSQVVQMTRQHEQLLPASFEPIAAAKELVDRELDRRHHPGGFRSPALRAKWAAFEQIVNDPDAAGRSWLERQVERFLTGTGTTDVEVIADVALRKLRGTFEYCDRRGEDVSLPDPVEGESTSQYRAYAAVAIRNAIADRQKSLRLASLDEEDWRVPVLEDVDALLEKDYAADVLHEIWRAGSRRTPRKDNGFVSYFAYEVTHRAATDVGDKSGDLTGAVWQALKAHWLVFRHFYAAAPEQPPLEIPDQVQNSGLRKRVYRLIADVRDLIQRSQEGS